MKHVYEINERGELYVADSEEQVREYYKSLVDEEPKYVMSMADNTVDAGGLTYAEIAAEYDEPFQIATTYC